MKFEDVFEDVWATFQLIGCLAIAGAGLLALLVLTIVSPVAGGAVLLAIVAFVAYRVATVRRDQDERGSGGLRRLVTEFGEITGTPPHPTEIAGGWTPEAILLRATQMSEDEADRLSRIFRRLIAENDVLDVLEAHPSAVLALVRAFDNKTRAALSPRFFEIGRRAGRPIWDRLIWPPQEQLLRQRLPESSVRKGEVLEARFADAQSAAAQAAQAALLAGWAPAEDVAWLSRPWRDVFGPAPEKVSSTWV